MKTKLILTTLILSSILCYVHGLPRTQRQKPVVNRNLDKLNSTDKPAEARKNALFPKNNKKYVVTENPLPRTTSSSSYKYFIVKRPLMLKFEPLSKTFFRKNNPVEHKSLMKKVQFIVSTPSPYERKIKKDYWKSRRPVHLKNNKSVVQDDISNTTPIGQIKEENNTQHTKSVPLTTTIRTPAKGEVPKDVPQPKQNETSEIIILPVSQNKLKSNPKEIVDEVKDIISLINKLNKNKNKDRITTTETATEILPTQTEAETQAIARTTSSSASTASTPAKEEKGLSDQTPDEDIKDISFEIPKINVTEDENVIPKNEKSTTQDNVQTTASFSPESTSESDVTETTSSNIVFIPVELHELKSHPNLILDEVKNIVKDMNELDSKKMNVTSPQKSENATTTEITTIEIKMKTEKVSTTPVVFTKEHQEHFESTTFKSMEENQSQSPYDDIGDVVYELPKNNSTPITSITTTEHTTTPFTENNLNTEKYLPEIVILPIELDNFMSQPPLAEDKDDTNERSTESSSTIYKENITTSSSTSKMTTTSSTSTSTTVAYETSTPSSTHVTEATSKPTQVTQVSQSTEATLKNSSPEVIFIPVNLEDFKSNPSIVVDEVKDIMNNLNNQETSSTEKQENPISTESTTYQLDVTTKTTKLISTTPAFIATTTPLVIETTTASLPVTETTTTLITMSTENPTTEKLTSPEVIFVPVNLQDIQSNPVVADELRDIINYMNNLHPQNKSHTKITPENDQSTSTVAPVNPERDTTVKQTTTKSSTAMPIQEPTRKPSLDLKTEATTQHIFDTTLNETQATTDPVLSTKSTTETTTEKEQLKLTDEPSQEPISTMPTTASKATESADTTMSSNSSPEIVFIPVNLEELKNNPDLVENEVKDVVDDINRKDKDSSTTTTVKSTMASATTEKLSSEETTTSILLETTTLKLEPKSDNKPEVVIEPIQLTPLDDDDDIFIGHITKSKLGNGKYNSINDDISDVVYVLKEDKNKKS